MNIKRNRILLGTVIAIIGLAIFFKPGAGFFTGLWSALAFCLGLALILLYRTKRKIWSLIIGGYLAYYGAASFLTPIIGHKIFTDLLGAMFFLVPATAFLIIYKDKNRRELLIPASFMLWFGLFLGVRAVPFVRGLDTAGLFMTFMGAALVTANAIDRARPVKTGMVLYVGAGLAAVGLLRIFVANPFDILGGIGGVAAAALVALGLLIIIRAVRNRP